MGNLIWLLVVIGIIAAVLKLTEQRGGAGKNKDEKKDRVVEFNYKLKPYFFSRTEQAFYLELHKQMRDKYAIFSKVRIPDFIDVDVDKYRDKGRWQSHWNRIKSKHVDFLLCDLATLKPLIAIEVNGKSHNSEKMIARDEFVGKVYEAAGIKFVTVKVGENYAEKISSL